MGIKSKRQVKDDSRCHNHGGWLTVSKAYSNPVDPFLEEAKAVPPFLQLEDDSYVSIISKASAHFCVSQEYAQMSLSVCSQLFLSILKVQRQMLRACFRQSIFYLKAEKEKNLPLVPSMPGFLKHQEVDKRK